MIKTVLVALGVACLSACLNPNTSVSAQLLSAKTEQKKTELKIVLRAPAQLFYQLDCLAGQGNCSQGAYRKLWQDLGLESELDHAILPAWKTLKSRYQRSVVKGELPPSVEPLVFQNPSLWSELREQVFSAPDLPTLVPKLKAILSAEDSQTLAEILMPLLEGSWGKWWQDAEPQLQRMASDLRQAFETADLGPELEQIRHFYQASPDALAQLEVHLLLQGPGVRNLSLGEQVGRHSLLEVSPQHAMHSHLDALVHEWCHALFKQMSPERQVRLQAFFSPDDLSYYHVLDESVATAIGNGRIKARVLKPEFFTGLLQKEQSFYRDVWIDSLGKALYRMRATTTGTLESQAFLRQYLQAAKNLWPREQLIPSLRVSAVFVADPQFKGILSDWQNQLRPWSLTSIVGGGSAPAFFERYPQLNGLIWLGPDFQDWQAWEKLWGKPAIDALQTQSSSAFVYGLKHQQRRFYIVRAPDKDSLLTLLRSLEGEAFTGFRP